MGPNTDVALSAKLKEALLAWDPTPHGGRYVGARMHLTGFKPGDTGVYDDLRDALEIEDEP